jgi:hypothetical protein
MRSRSSGGANSSGRYKKHDTARNNCLQRVVYPGLRMGKLPTAEDAKMLFDLPGPNEILGPDKKKMDEWSNIYARDPRSKEPSIFHHTVEDQSTLLRWAQSMSTSAPRAAPVGRPHVLRTQCAAPANTLTTDPEPRLQLFTHRSYKHEFGAHKEKTFDVIIRENGSYVKWLCGKSFSWSWPRHGGLFDVLLELEDRGVYDGVSPRSSHFTPEPLPGK